MKFIKPFSVIIVSGLLFTDKALSSMLKMFPGVSERYFRSLLSPAYYENVPSVFRFVF
jgi:hypothetical protein